LGIKTKGNRSSIPPRQMSRSSSAASGIGHNECHGRAAMLSHPPAATVACSSGGGVMLVDGTVGKRCWSWIGIPGDWRWDLDGLDVTNDVTGIAAAAATAGVATSATGACLVVGVNTNDPLSSAAANDEELSNCEDSSSRRFSSSATRDLLTRFLTRGGGRGLELHSLSRRWHRSHRYPFAGPGMHRAFALAHVVHALAMFETSVHMTKTFGSGR
jgi:hypothetical protein